MAVHGAGEGDVAMALASIRFERGERGQVVSVMLRSQRPMLMDVNKILLRLAPLSLDGHALDVKADPHVRRRS